MKLRKDQEVAVDAAHVQSASPMAFKLRLPSTAEHCQAEAEPILERHSVDELERQVQGAPALLCASGYRRLPDGATTPRRT